MLRSSDLAHTEAQPDSGCQRCPIVDVGLRRPVCRSAGIAAVRERALHPLRMDDLLVTARDLSADDDERGLEWLAFEGVD